MPLPSTSAATRSASGVSTTTRPVGARKDDSSVLQDQAPLVQHPDPGAQLLDLGQQVTRQEDGHPGLRYSPGSGAPQVP